MTDNSNEKHDQLNREHEALSELASRITTRHLSLAEQVSAGMLLPLRAFSIAPKGLPVLARKLFDRVQWGNTVTGRAGALSDRIHRSVQKTLFPVRPIEKAWFRKRHSVDDSAFSVEQEEHEIPVVEAPYNDLEKGTPAIAGRKPSPAGAAAFATVHHNRVQRTPVVGFSPSILESMGISRPPATLMEEGIQSITGDAELQHKPEPRKSVTQPLTLRRKSEAAKTETVPKQVRPTETSPEQQRDFTFEKRQRRISGKAYTPQPTLYKKGLAALSALKGLIPFVGTRKEDLPPGIDEQPDAAPSPPGVIYPSIPETGEKEQIERPVHSQTEKTFAIRESRLLPSKNAFKGIIARKPLRLNVFRAPSQRRPAGLRELPLYKPALLMSKRSRITGEISPVAPEYRVSGAARLEESWPAHESAMPGKDPVSGVEDIPVTRKSLAEEIAGKYQQEEIEKSNSLEMVPRLAQKQDTLTMSEEESGRGAEASAGELPERTTEGEHRSGRVPGESTGQREQEADASTREIFSARLTRKYIPGKMTTGHLPFVQRLARPDSTYAGMTVTELARALTAKHLPSEDKGSPLYEPTVDSLDEISPGREQMRVPPVFQKGESGPGRKSSGYTETFAARAPARVLRRRRAEPVYSAAHSSAMIQGKFERPERALARTGAGPAEDGVSDLMRMEVDTNQQTEQRGAEEEDNTEAIARQVYAIIKRRLAVEKERAGYR